MKACLTLIIREWYVKTGDMVKSDQPLVSMETAKALVDVPSPVSAKVEKLFGNPGDTIETGQPLIGFEGEIQDSEKSTSGETNAHAETADPSGAASANAATVVRALAQKLGVNLADISLESDYTTAAARELVDVTSETGQPIMGFAGGSLQDRTAASAKATPAVRALAKKLGVNLADISPQGNYISSAEVEAAHKATVGYDLEPLSPMRRAMVISMSESHRSVVPVTLSDDADISAWDDQQDITIRLIRAVAAGCEEVPMLNATFDDEKLAYRLNPEINLGIAVDTPHGLYVPVIKNIAAQENGLLREKINQFKQQAQEKSIQQADLHGATIILSNFGAFAGRYANPIVVPPMVAIIGIGKARDEVVADAGKPAIHRIIPLSITVDHRLVTGGESARFLKTMIDALAKK